MKTRMVGRFVNLFKCVASWRVQVASISVLALFTFDCLHSSCIHRVVEECNLLCIVYWTLNIEHWTLNCISLREMGVWHVTSWQCWNLQSYNGWIVMRMGSFHWFVRSGLVERGGVGALILDWMCFISQPILISCDPPCVLLILWRRRDVTTLVRRELSQ